MMPSAAAAASAYEAGSPSSPSTGVAPRFCTCAALWLFRTSPCTWWPARESASRTAAPMYPVPPVRKIRTSDIPNTLLMIVEGDQAIFADLEHRAIPPCRHHRGRERAFHRQVRVQLRRLDVQDNGTNRQQTS